MRALQLLEQAIEALVGVHVDAGIGIGTIMPPEALAPRRQPNTLHLTVHAHAHAHAPAHAHTHAWYMQYAWYMHGASSRIILHRPCEHVGHRLRPNTRALTPPRPRHAPPPSRPRHLVTAACGTISLGELPRAPPPPCVCPTLLSHALDPPPQAPSLSPQAQVPKPSPEPDPPSPALEPAL